MSVRISQYETGARIPGEDMILKLADALHCNYKAISDYSLGAAEDIIETLFWLEESATSLPARGKGTRFPEYTAPGNLIHLTTMTPAKTSETARPTYNEDDYDSAGSPVALTFEYGYSKENADTSCIMQYYIDKLRENGINPKPCAIKDDDGEVVADDFPPDYNYLENYVCEIVSSYDFIESPESCSQRIAVAFRNYTKENYTDKDISYFKDYPIERVIELSEVSKKWKYKFELANVRKKEFLELPICKKVKDIINESSVNEYVKKEKETKA